MGDYKKLCAICETTKDRKNPLAVQIGGGGEHGLVISVVQAGKAKRVLATAPFEPGYEDEAARDVARQLTIDGGLPRGMD